MTLFVGEKMAILRRNIWTLFFILFVGAFFTLALVSYYKWQEINEEHHAEQSNLVELLSSSVHSLLLTQEMMLDIVGRELLKDESYKHLVKSPELLDNILSLNPSIVSFGLATPEGKLTFVGSNLDTSTLPNLKELAVTKDSFNRALMSDKMVLGRSYFYNPVNDWVIPIRKAIRDSQGNVVVIMTAGLRIKGASKLLSDDLRRGDYAEIALIRDQDKYLQFLSSIQEDLHKVYNTPVSPEIFENIKNSAQQKEKLSIETLKEKEQHYIFDTMGIGGKHVQAIVKYDKRYEIWTYSHMEKAHIFSQFIIDFFLFCLIFGISQIVLYILFRYIANAEQKRRQELMFQATHDALTGLPNRSYLQHCIHDWIYKDSPSFSLFYIDMDHFKNVNDSFGHEFGDNVLIELSKRLKSLMRDDSIVLRQGGDEFLILSSCVSDEKLLQYGQAIINSASQPYYVRGLSFVIGASIGIAKYPEHGENLDMLLRSADIAMYESKKHRNAVSLFADFMQRGYLDKVVIEQKLRKAVENNLLYMVYQPQVDAEGIPYGVEALVRWEDKNLGFVSPMEFIPIAEASGVMPRLGNFIIRSSLQEIKQLQEDLGRELQVSINISVRQFMETSFLENLQKTIDEVGISHECIMLEMTESILIEDVNYILPLLEKIHGLGIGISMDDFGTGYSSLNMLRSLPTGELKIDKSFVDTILNDETARKMIQNIIAIGKNLDMCVLAEGVETKEQETILKSFGCDRFQGYYYAKPMPYEALKAFFLSKL